MSARRFSCNSASSRASASVSGAVSSLLSEGGEGLLDDIGGTEGTLWPWTDAPTEKLTAVFDAVGPADTDF